MAKEIKFYSSKIPPLKAGFYKMYAQQVIKKGGRALENNLKSNNTGTFFVDGPKFELEPGIVNQTYPEDGLVGNYIADLPSLTLNRISMPWERKRAKLPGEDGRTKVGEDDSWLILLMVNEEEAEEIEEGSKSAQDLYNITDDRDRYYNSNVNFVKIPKSLRNIFPKSKDFKFLSYCRTEGGEENREGAKSVILCNRLPTPDNKNTVYLLSLEKMKEEGEYDIFPYLYKWTFYCKGSTNYYIPKREKIGDFQFPESITDTLFTSKTDFEKALKDLDNGIVNHLLKDILKKYKQDLGTFHGRLQQLKGKLSSLKYPIVTHNEFINRGGVILKEGDKYKWYRGPLQAAPMELLLDPENKQKWTGIKRYLSKEERRNYVAPNDKTYQIAFELGVLTALKDEAFHKPFFEWKREICTALLIEDNKNSERSIREHNMADEKIRQDKPMPPVVKQKIEDWKKLKGIPYSYLIPSMKMLPLESIRTFFVDVNWVNAFLLGAFSVGNTYDRTEVDFFKILDKGKSFLKENIYGFLLHSLVVSGYPEYEVEAVKTAGRARNKTTKVNRRKLAKNIELHLFEINDSFEKRADQYTFNLPDGKTYSGFRYDSIEDKFVKQYREEGKAQDDILDVPFYNEKGKSQVSPIPDKRIIDVKTLAGEKSPAEFGRMMLEGVPKVVYDINYPAG